MKNYIAIVLCLVTSLASMSSVAAIRFDGPNTFFEKYEEHREETSVILSGADARALNEFLPALEVEWIARNPELLIQRAGNVYISPDEGALCFGTKVVVGDGGNSGGHIGGPAEYRCLDRELVYRSKYLITDLSRDYDKASPLICFTGAKESYCRIAINFSASDPNQPDFNTRIPFNGGHEASNNNLGKTLKGRSFQTSNGRFQLSCDTLAEDRYYDCFITLR